MAFMCSSTPPSSFTSPFSTPSPTSSTISSLASSSSSTHDPHTSHLPSFPLSSSLPQPWTTPSSLQSGKSFRLCAREAAGAAKYGETSRPAMEVAPTTRRKRRKRVFLVDVHPLCYDGSKPSTAAFVKWMKLLFSQATHQDPVIAVMDGERGNLRRRALLPSYKANRNRYPPRPWRVSEGVDLRRALPCIGAFFRLCHIPVVKFDDAEADDVIASLMHAASSQQGMDVVIASPDMDFRQLLAENVQLLLPVPELHKWSFYTLQLYVAQQQCHPKVELGMRCLLGDRSDCVPGLPEFAPGFGRKTALKLMRKHGSLEALLEEAAVRTVGKAFVQEALTKYASLLRRNHQVLSLKMDMDITFEEEWCLERDASNDVVAFATLEQQFLELGQSQSPKPISHPHRADIYKR